MHLSSGLDIPDGLLAATALVAENSRLGVPASTHTLHRDFGFAISNTALGLRGSLYDDGVGSRCTGKERDQESGLDYFGARYYSSNIGRWTSPDPSGLTYADPTNPQSLNLYSYVLNNPSNFFDPDGLRCGSAAASATAQRMLGTVTGSITNLVCGLFDGNNSPTSTQSSLLGFYNTATAIQSQHVAQQQSSGRQLWATTEKGGPHGAVWDVQWKLSETSKTGGWIVQHITADLRSTDGPIHADYWEAWQMPKGSQYLPYHSWSEDGADDRFSGGITSTIHAEARYYDGLKLPGSFKGGSNRFAGYLRATDHNPNLPNANATPPFVRDWFNSEH